MRKKLRFRKILFLIVLLCVTALLRSVWMSKYQLTTTHYEIIDTTAKLIEPIRIVQLSDQHNSEFGENNCKLIEAVKEQSPDLILITGDVINAKEGESTDVAKETITQLVEIAPVYISYGNHENIYEETYGVNMKELYESWGATVLDTEFLDIEVKGQPVRIGGIYGYLVPDKYIETGETVFEELLFMDQFLRTDSYTILLTHLPSCWLLNDGLEEWDVDCVFAGHVHGGQVILPGIGGVYAPDFGYFPGYLQGVYSSKDGKTNMVLSRGLGSTEVVPRINNVPEIVVTDIVPENE